jgi:hypothetical protein
VTLNLLPGINAEDLIDDLDDDEDYPEPTPEERRAAMLRHPSNYGRVLAAARDITAAQP